MADWSSIIGWIATLTSNGLQLISLQICWRVMRQGSTGDISPFPFIVYAASCSVWLKYGLMENISAVITTNLIGAMLYSLCTVVFYVYTTRRSQFHRYLFIGLVMLLSPLLYVQYYQTVRELAVRHLGLYCAVCTCAGYSAPLASLSDVIRTKSTECLSFPLVFINFVLGLEWAYYGYLIRDSFVMFPNFGGVLVCLIQLSLFVFYPSKSTITGATIHT